MGLVEDKVATIPASAFFNAINNKLIPNAIPKKPLKKDLIFLILLITYIVTFFVLRKFKI